MSWIKRFRAIWIISPFILILGLLPYRPAVFISKDDYLLVSPQACGCPCPEVKIKKGEIVIPKQLFAKHATIITMESNLTNDYVISDQSVRGEYYDYYIKGKVVDIDTVLCDILACEVTPVLSVEECYLAEYVPIIYAINSPVLLVAFILNLVVVLPAIVITKIVTYIIGRN